MSDNLLIQAVADAAADWREPDYEFRIRAVESTLKEENAFTEEAVAFAVNQQMALLTEEGLRDWLRGRSASRPVTVGVLNAGNIPFVGLQDFLAVVLTGHAYLGSVSSKSPHLLPAFADDLRGRYPDLRARFAEASELFSGSEAVVATGSDDTLAWVRERCDEGGIPDEARLLRGHSYSVAVLDGRETEDEYEYLAEDVLLHEGMGCRSIAVIWAPAGLSPDPLLEAFARFRSVFPRHEDTPGRLALQQAFLEAVDTPHAYGEGLEFLVSRGDPEEQTPGHVRWSEYEVLEEVEPWLRERKERIQLAAASERIRGRLGSDVPVVPFGQAQRPPLGWCPDGIDTIDFLAALGSAGRH